MPGLNRGLGQEAALGKFSVEDTVLEQAVGTIDQGAGGLLFLSKTRHAAIYSKYILRRRRICKLISTDILVPPHLLALRPYEPGLSAEEVQQRFGLSRVVKLASNENPLGSSPLAIEAAQRALVGMERY